MDIPCQLDEVSYFVPLSYYPFQLLCLQAYCILVRNRLQLMSIMNRLRSKQPRIRGSIHDRNKETLSFPKHSDRVGSPRSLLFSRHRGLSSRDEMVES